MLHGVTLRPITLADATQRYADWLNDPEVSRFMETRWSVHTVRSAREYIDEHPGLLAICVDGLHVGNIKIWPLNAWNSCADVSLFIGDKSYWRKGIGSESIKQAVASVEKYGLRKVEAGIYAPNVASLAAFLKAGFKIEGWRDSAAAFEGGRCDVIMVGMVL